MRQILIFFIVVLMTICMIGCSKSDHTRMLHQADLLMESSPDSAFVILKGIDSLGLDSEKETALFNLLYSQASFKTGILDIQLGLIDSATHYFLEHHDNNHLMRSSFYLAQAHYGQQNYRDAMTWALVSYNIASESGASLWIARSAELIADMHDHNHNHRDCLAMTIKALDAYSDAGFERNHHFSTCDLASTLQKNGYYERAEKILDSICDMAANELRDTVLLAYALQTGVSVNLKRDQSDKLKRIFDRLSVLSDYYTLNVADMATLAKLYVRSHEWEKADSLIAVSLDNSIGFVDSAFVYEAKSNIYKARGDYRRLSEIQDTLLMLQNREVANTILQSAVATERDYYNIQSEVNKRKVRHRTSVLIFTIVLTIVILLVGFIYYKIRIRLKEADRREQLATIMELSNQIEQQEDSIRRISQDMENLFREEWGMLNTLCNEYFEKGFSESDRKIFLKDVDGIIKNLTSDKNFKKIEESVNRHLDNIIVRLSEQCPFIKKEDLKFITLVYAGFSARAVCLFTDIKLKYFYAKRTRLIERIQRSEAPDAAFFVEKMS